MNYKSRGYLFPLYFSVYLNGVAFPVIYLTSLVFEAQSLPAFLDSGAEGRRGNKCFPDGKQIRVLSQRALLGMLGRRVDKTYCQQMPRPVSLSAGMWLVLMCVPPLC